MLFQRIDRGGTPRGPLAARRFSAVARCQRCEPCRDAACRPLALTAQPRPVLLQHGSGHPEIPYSSSAHEAPQAAPQKSTGQQNPSERTGCRPGVFQRPSHSMQHPPRRCIAAPQWVCGQLIPFAAPQPVLSFPSPKGNQARRRILLRLSPSQHVQRYTDSVPVRRGPDDTHDVGRE